MKKVFIGSVFFLYSLLVTSSCYAAAYFSANLGMVTVDDADVTDPSLTAMGLSDVEISFDNGVCLALAAGSRIYDDFRVEAEFSYRQNDMDSLFASSGGLSASVPVNGEIESMTLLGNLIVDIKNNSVFTPFAGMGLGFSNIDAEIERESEDDTVFAYQVILGAGIRVNDITTIDLSYRYFATSAPDFEGTEVEYATHNIMAGVRLSF